MLSAIILAGVFEVILDEEEEIRVRRVDPSMVNWAEEIMSGRALLYDYENIEDGVVAATFHLDPKAVGSELDEDELISICASRLDDAGINYKMCDKRKKVEDLGSRKYRITVQPY
jgi:hypothetical protein